MKNIDGLHKILKGKMGSPRSWNAKSPIRLESYKDNHVDYWKLKINYGLDENPKASKGEARLDFKFLPNRKILKMEGVLRLRDPKSTIEELRQIFPNLRVFPASNDNIGIVYSVGVNKLRKEMGLKFINGGRPDKNKQKEIFETILKRLKILAKPEIAIAKSTIN